MKKSVERPRGWPKKRTIAGLGRDASRRKGHAGRIHRAAQFSVSSSKSDADARTDADAEHARSLISTYELGRQPFGLASPAAWLRAAGWDVTCVDVAKERLPRRRRRAAELVGFHLPMHTATRLAAPVIRQGAAAQRPRRASAPTGCTRRSTRRGCARSASTMCSAASSRRS